MTVHDSEMLEEIIPLLQHLDSTEGTWVPFSHENDRDFAAAARWLTHHPDSPAAHITKGRTLAIQWMSADPGPLYVTGRTTHTPVLRDGARVGRIRFRTARPQTRKKASQ